MPRLSTRKYCNSKKPLKSGKQVKSTTTPNAKKNLQRGPRAVACDNCRNWKKECSKDRFPGCKSCVSKKKKCTYSYADTKNKTGITDFTENETKALSLPVSPSVPIYRENNVTAIPVLEKPLNCSPKKLDHELKVPRCTPVSNLPPQYHRSRMNSMPELPSFSSVFGSLLASVSKPSTQFNRARLNSLPQLPKLSTVVENLPSLQSSRVNLLNHLPPIANLSPAISYSTPPQSLELDLGNYLPPIVGNPEFKTKCSYYRLN
ncbi:hypothetical protein K502DRAFT_325830 [Neoconidiobolus thromboides FSU 785]|nr:hypothetical protein K502DRAFT_325830 [Neoconidiobolus thromboides FSU 785]